MAIPSERQATHPTQSYDRSEAFRMENIRMHFARSGAPERHRQQSKAGLSQHPEWMAARKKVDAVILRRGMCALIGSPGSGKTQIGVEALKTDLLSHARPVRYEVAADVFALIREAYGPNATRTELQIIRDFTMPHLLVIDEIDKMAGTDSDKRLLYRILDKRYRSDLPTLLIGNVDDAEALKVLLDGFAGEGIGPIFDRLRQTGGIVTTFGWNFRERGMQ